MCTQKVTGKQLSQPRVLCLINEINCAIFGKMLSQSQLKIMLTLRIIPLRVAFPSFRYRSVNKDDHVTEPYI